MQGIYSHKIKEKHRIMPFTLGRAQWAGGLQHRWGTYKSQMVFRSVLSFSAGGGSRSAKLNTIF